VLLILGAMSPQSADSAWSEVKKQLSGTSSFVTRVLNFDARSIPARTRADLERYLANHSNSFEDAVIRRASVAAAPLAGWLKANLRYAAVIERIAPIENRYAAVRASLEAAAARMADCQEKRAKVEARVEELQAEFAARTGEVEALKGKLAVASESLKKAGGLLEKLGGERSRWNSQLQQIEKEAANNDLQSVGISAYIVKLAVKFESHRAASLQEWSALLGVSIDVGKCSDSSPEDLSLGSAVAISESLDAGLVPLIVDSSGQALQWLKSGLKFEAVSSTDPRFLNTLELAYRFGKRLVVTTNSAEIPAVLDPYLRRDLQGSGRPMIALGEKSVDFNAEFRLAIVSTELTTFDRLKQPFKSLVVAINLAVTAEGVETQLLSRAINFERPELESRRAALLQSQMERSRQLRIVEEQLLTDLASASGNILENNSLMASLSAAKANAEEISRALLEGKQLESEIEAQREAFKQVAQQGSRYFLLLQSLGSVNPSYRFGLVEFLVSVFDASLKEAKATRERPVTVLTRRSLSYGVQALQKGDRHLFGLLLCRIQDNSPISRADWDAFLGHGTGDSVGPFSAVIEAQRNRPETLIFEIEKFITQTMNVDSVMGMAPPAPESMGASKRVLFFTAPDSDASAECRRIAGALNLALSSLPLGSSAGAETQALEVLGRGSNQQAILISNLHLASDRFLEALPKSIEESSFGAVFMTAELSRVLPSALLENALKIAWEAAPGFKRNVLRCLDSMTEQSFSFFTASGSRANMLAALVGLHAALNERRRFVPQGWRRSNYEFTGADFLAAVETLRMLLTSGGSQTAFFGLLQEAVYAVKLDCDQDMRIFDELVRRFFGSAPLLPAPDAASSLASYKTRLEQQLDEARDLEAVGLAANAAAAVDAAAGRELVRRLAGHQTAADLAGGSDVLEAAKSFWDARSEISVRLSNKTSSFGPRNPWAQFLQAELLLACDLFDKIRRHLVSGTDELKSMLASRRAPTDWEWKYSPEDPLELLETVVRKTTALAQLASESGEFPAVVTLSDFFRPDVLVQTLRQKAARDLDVSLEELRLVGSTDERVSRNSVGVAKLVLEGAVFDAKYGTLRDERRETIRSEFPIVNLEWRKLGEESEMETLGGRVKVPVYADGSHRQHLIFEISMTADDVKMRTLNAVALFVDNKL
jgi:dynein heavy chain 2